MLLFDDNAVVLGYNRVYLWQINTCAVPEEEEEVISDVLVQHKHSMDFIEKASEHPNKVC